MVDLSVKATSVSRPRSSVYQTKENGVSGNNWIIIFNEKKSVTRSKNHPCGGWSISLEVVWPNQFW